MKALLFILLLATSAQAQRGYILCNIPDRYDHVSLYINSVWSDVEWCADKYNIPMQLILAQMCLESAYGSSYHAKMCNHLGIKFEGKYATFASLRNCLDVYGRTLRNGECYKSMQPVTVSEWLTALQYECCGYHRSKNYTRKINWLIAEFNLNVL